MRKGNSTRRKEMKRKTPKLEKPISKETATLNVLLNLFRKYFGMALITFDF